MVTLRQEPVTLRREGRVGVGFAEPLSGATDEGGGPQSHAYGKTRSQLHAFARLAVSVDRLRQGGVSATLGPVDSIPPQASPSDRALSYALWKQGYFKRGLNRARFLVQVGEMTILLTTAATVVVAALHASAIVTATLAAVSLFFTGFRLVFGPNENWVRTARAWMALEQVIMRYQLIPEGERDGAAQRELMEQVLRISAEETSEWAVQQGRRTPGEVAPKGSAVQPSEKS